MGQVLAREGLPEQQTGRRWVPAWSTGFRFPLVLLGPRGARSPPCHQLTGTGRWPSLGQSRLSSGLVLQAQSQCVISAYLRNSPDSALRP